jgi:hypothetical protein
MRLITTEAQRHRETEIEKDPRTAPIIGAAIEVRRAIGPGLLEFAYEECLCHELHIRGLSFMRQIGFYADKKVVVERWAKEHSRKF